MANKTEPVVMYDSPEAAELRTITGWVSRLGHYYGANEHLARFDGCTHTACRGCGAATPRGWTHCDNCRAEQSEKDFAALPFEPYAEQVCRHVGGDEFFFGQDDIVNYAEENEIPYASLRLVKCEPRYAEEVSPEEVYEDLIPEDGELPGYVLEAFAVLNATLRAKRDQPICWMPVDVRVVLPEDFPVYVNAEVK